MNTKMAASLCEKAWYNIDNTFYLNDFRSFFTANNFFLKNIYVLLDGLVCSIVEHFYSSLVF